MEKSVGTVNEINNIVYPVIFTEDESNILIEVPDLDILTECNEEGQKKGTISDAIVMARDAIGLKIITSEECKMPIQKPSSLHSIDASKGAFADEGESFVSLVDVDITEYRRKHDNRMVKKNCTIPYYLNVMAEEAGINFSKLLQEALATKFHLS